MLVTTRETESTDFVPKSAKARIGVIKILSNLGKVDIFQNLRVTDMFGMAGDKLKSIGLL